MSPAVFNMMSESAQENLHAHALCIRRTQQRIMQVQH